MKINTKPALVGIAGLFIIVVSTIRWYFIWYDLSQAVIGVGMGCIVLFFAFMYNWMKNADTKLNEMDIKMQGYSKYFMEREFK